MRHHTTCPIQRTKDIADREVKLKQEELGRTYPWYWHEVFNEVIEEQVGKDLYTKEQI